MNNQLLEIEPTELKFLFELKKPSSCYVQLTNNTNCYVAYKVKTTAPKKYSVRPNVGVVMPKSTCKFIVTMQAPKVAPADMICKDKFLIQSIVVRAGTTDEEINSSLFVKDGDRYIEENKLTVALISPTSSPELSSINGDFKNGLAYEKEQIFSREEIHSPEPMIIQNEEHWMANEESKHRYTKLNPEQDVGLKIMKEVEELKPETDELEESKEVELNIVEDVEELKPEKEAQLNVSKGVEEPKLMEAIQEMKFKLDKLESKLEEAGVSISKLTEERRLSNLETRILQEKIADLSKRGVTKVQVGFPLLYVCMVALICVFLGYRSQC